MKSIRKICAALAAILIGAAGMAAAEAGTAAQAPAGEGNRTARFEEKGLELGESAIAYPAMKEGAAEEEIREAVNDRILEDGKIRDYAARVSQLISGGKLRVSWQGAELGPVFSFGVAAEGAVETPRSTFVWTGGNIDLRDGHEIAPEEIFTDPEAAREVMESYLEDEVAPELSAHLQSGEITPLPELFRMTERGLVWMYPIDRLSTLGDRAGDVLIPWHIVREQLRTEPDGIPAAMGVEKWIATAEKPAAELIRENAEAIRAAVEAGEIPGIPARLGDGMQALTDRWHELTDPDIYAGGRLFALEGAAFRNVFLTTDFLSESWENSVVDGIRTDLGGFLGLTVGETEQAAWREALGEPDHTLPFDGEQAEAYRTVPGSRDYYAFGGHRLQLHADEAGLLASIILSE